MESGPLIVKDVSPTGDKVPPDALSSQAGTADGRGSFHATGRHDAGNRNQSRSKVKPPKLYRIGEVVDYSGMSRQTVHNYTIMGLLHESKWTSGGHRLYDESVFERLDEIAELKSKNMSMEEIREHFNLMNKP